MTHTTDIRREGHRPALLDLYSCAGGAGGGYDRAGFAVTGVDIRPRPNYPFAFIQGDALAVLDDLIDSGEIRRYNAIHASPPCQKRCALTVGTNRSRGWGGQHVDLVAPTRKLLEASGLPYVIEQPDGKADVRKDITLCGEMFGLGVLRHRNFELGGWNAPQPVHKPHRGRVRGWRHGRYFDGPYVAAYGSGGGKATVAEMQTAMGIDWTDVREELTEAIPPAYSEWLGHAFLTCTTAAVVAV
ncbi:DNA methylase [Streptomyces sp. NPDC087297]|uniref:DNA methylase n=1 Tax=Streptomyces sp. NPDC087297 TaxID=3365778 RepID=UPI0037FEA361